jgi:hypothetical protein
MGKYIEPLYFFIAFVLGMLYVYLSTPEPDILIKYPVPEHSDNIIYKDHADVCYKYSSEEVSCPSDKTKIKKIGLQYVKKDQDTPFSLAGLFS